MIELSPSHIAVLERIIASGYSIVAFPLYANVVGVRKGECAALLEPLVGGGLRLFGEPCFLVDGNLTVRVTRDGRSWFVWKKQKLEATPERLETLAAFQSELEIILEPHV